MGLSKGLWPEELQKALWALKTSPTRATGFSPFKLLFGHKAMTPGELTARSLRATQDINPANREISIDLVEENHMEAISTMAKYVDGVARAYNKKVRPCPLAPGDMVLKRVANPSTVGKLESKWEGPYIIQEHEGQYPLHRHPRGTTARLYMEHQEPPQVIPLEGFLNSVGKPSCARAIAPLLARPRGGHVQTYVLLGVLSPHNEQSTQHPTNTGNEATAHGLWPRCTPMSSAGTSA